MKTKRGLPFFRPLDKSAFARRRPDGARGTVFWQGIREEQVTANADWLAANLKQFGCQYVQIDDGWQGVGQGDGVNRDWYVTEKHKFPRGMKWLADYIRAKGITPGIWLIPFATSDAKLFRAQPDLFVRRADGSSVYETPDAKTGKIEVDWTGRYVVDPTSPKAHAWFQDLFHMICDDWGYDYVKIDGQGGSTGACRRFPDRLANPKTSPDDAYRSGLATIKSVMGAKRFLLNCGGQYASCGYCEGIRIGGDVGARIGRACKPAIQATMACLYMNNLGFWTDPDVVCVRPPLTLDQARALGHAGGHHRPTADDQRRHAQARRGPRGDSADDSSPWPTSGRWNSTRWRASRGSSICGWPRRRPDNGTSWPLFNWDTRSTTSLRLDPQELGWPAGGYVYYDVWEKKLLGAGAGGLTLGLPTTSCKLVAARPMADHPQLVGTSRHITQGADDLLEARWDSAAGRWAGRSRVVGGDPYQLRFTLPPGWTCTDAESNDRGVRWLSSRCGVTRTGRSAWQCGFQTACGRRGQAADQPCPGRGGRIGRYDLLGKEKGRSPIASIATASCSSQTGDTSLTDRGRPRGTWRYEVAAVNWQGDETVRVPAGVFDAQADAAGDGPRCVAR